MRLAVVLSVCTFGLKKMRVVETGGRAYMRERTQWDSSANIFCASPRRSLRIGLQHLCQSGAAKARFEVVSIVGAELGRGGRSAPQTGRN